MQEEKEKKRKAIRNSRKGRKKKKAQKTKSCTIVMFQTGSKLKDRVILCNGWSANEETPFDSVMGHPALKLVPGEGNVIPASDASDIAMIISRPPTVFDY